MAKSYDETYARLCILIEPYLVDEQRIEPQSLLVDDLGLDSVQTLEVLMEMEDWMDIAIPMNVLPEVHTVDDLVKALRNL